MPMLTHMCFCTRSSLQESSRFGFMYLDGISDEFPPYSSSVPISMLDYRCA